MEERRIRHTEWAYCQTCMNHQDHEEKSPGVWVCLQCRCQNNYVVMAESIKSVAKKYMDKEDEQDWRD